MSGDSIVPLVHADDAERFGGKAAQLGAALRAGLPVPDGHALDWQIVASAASGDASARERCVGAFVALGGGPVSVRSSAIGEDSETASFAGQHLTRLGVGSAAALLDALVAVAESAVTPAARAYRAQLGVGGEPRIGIVMQRMVEAECAGVLFTRDPVTGADLRVIEAAWGLGEGVVAGLVDPDRYRLRRGGAVVEATVGEKHVAIRAGADGVVGEHEVPAARRTARCLDADRLAALEALASACERVFGHERPHDIEWAFDRERLYLLQRRAVTR